MKESRATELWCPHRALVAATNHKLDDYGLCSCMGNACMMWVQTDNECEPQDSETKMEICYPAGFCGLIEG